jgi:hydrogenase maturation protease
LRTLVLGYGNVDRGDDGLGYYVVNEISRRLAHADLEPYTYEPQPVTGELSLLFQRQLTPEMAEFVAEFDQVIFVDAHTGAYDEEVRVVAVEPGYVPSALTHHMSPATLLALAKVMSGRSPAGYLCSARGSEFDFTTDLSERARVTAEQVVEKVLAMIRG